jgi:hypothetical protein
VPELVFDVVAHEGGQGKTIGDEVISTYPVHTPSSQVRGSTRGDTENAHHEVAEVRDRAGDEFKHDDGEIDVRRRGCCSFCACGAWMHLLQWQITQLLMGILGRIKTCMYKAVDSGGDASVHRRLHPDRELAVQVYEDLGPQRLRSAAPGGLFNPSMNVGVLKALPTTPRGKVAGQ